MENIDKLNKQAQETFIHNANRINNKNISTKHVNQSTRIHNLKYIKIKVYQTNSPPKLVT